MILATSTNALFERADGSRIPVEESIRCCAQAGYRALDFCFIDQITTKTAFLEPNWKRYLQEIREQAEALGVRFVQSHGPLYDFCNSSDPWQEELVRRSVEGSRLLGVPWMVMHPMSKVDGDRLSPSTAERNISYFRRLADSAGRFDVGIAVENMWGRTPEGVRRYTVDPEELYDLLDRIDAENVGACWDTEHGSIEGIDQGAAIRRLGDRLKALHISDQTSHVNVHILPYLGITDWDDILKALAEIGYDHPFTYEIQHYLLRLPLELAPAALRFSRELGSYMVQRLEQFKDPTNERSKVP